jgi:hypothetical protein
MDYLSLSDLRHFSLLADKNMWLFVVIAIPLIAFTIGVYIICECFGRAKKSRETAPDLLPI